VVNVRVREDNGIELLDGQRELSILFSGFLTTPLEHAAVESDSVAINVKEMTGAGDFPRGSDERYLQSVILLLLHRAERAVSLAVRPAT